jgi:hypothetical protein
VIEESKPHFVSIRLAMLLLMLGMCVFLWGFGYKLSLYDVHEQSLHRIPVAKLLSKNEDASTADGARQWLTAKDSREQLQPVMFVVAAIVSMGILTRPRQVRGRQFESAKAKSSAFCTALYFRPPPIHFVL